MLRTGRIVGWLREKRLPRAERRAARAAERNNPERLAAAAAAERARGMGQGGGGPASAG
jgi:hypothetical protein